MSVTKPEVKNDKNKSRSESGAALAIAIIIMALMMAVSVGVIAIANSDAGSTGSDLRRNQTFYVSAAGMEKMTNTFRNLLQRRLRPTTEELDEIEANKPTAFEAQGYIINQEIREDPILRAQMCAKKPLECTGGYPIVTIPPGNNSQAGAQYAGLYGILTPFVMESTAIHKPTGTKVVLQRNFNSYSVPLFQFGIFGDNDIEFHPGPQFNFNGRVHSNRNLYLGGNLLLEDKVTVGEELVYSVDRNGRFGRSRNVQVRVSGNNRALNIGSVNDGPFFSSTANTRGHFPDSPPGTVNTSWDTTSVSNCGSANCFNRQVLTRSTGAQKLRLPLQLDGASPREIIRRPEDDDTDNVREAKYANKASIRIYLDDNASWASNQTGGVVLENFDPIPLPEGGAATGTQNALIPIVGGNYQTAAAMTQRGTGQPARVVRGVRSDVRDVGGNRIPAGAGLRGRIRIEVIDSEGVARDVTREILSMGVTVGEPNAIVHLQRPIWAAFLPGNRSMPGAVTGTNKLPGNLSALLESNRWAIIDGEIRNYRPAHYDTNTNNGGYLADAMDDDMLLPVSFDPGPRFREDSQQNHFQLIPPSPHPATEHPQNTFDGTLLNYNRIVPINVYNVREGWSHGWPNGADNPERVTQRGMTSVVELNMKNLARWVAGYYDNNLLANSANAKSANIDSREGYVVYVSDRRGDGADSQNPDGIVNNENIYSENFLAGQTLDLGEDVINPGASLLPDNDETELPNPVGPDNLIYTQSGNTLERRNRAICANYDLAPVATNRPKCGNQTDFEKVTAAGWMNNNRTTGALSRREWGYFRRAVRVFDGEDLNPNTNPDRLSETKGITIASENMVYIWGNYNTTGIRTETGNPGGIAHINPGGYSGDQVPASFACDAFFPLSKTWFDGLSYMFPSGGNRRIADVGIGNDTQRTAVRAGIIAGMNISALSGNPDAHGPTAPSGNERESRLAGGIHNFPRFLENWDSKKWSYAGSLIVLYYSNQAMGQWNDIGGTIYSPPERNWSFDLTYRDPRRLPPGTPFFQYVEPTNFRQLIDGTPN
jgi:hypothetical protein